LTKYDICGLLPSHGILYIFAVYDDGEIIISGKAIYYVGDLSNLQICKEREELDEGCVCLIKAKGGSRFGILGNHREVKFIDEKDDDFFNLLQSEVFIDYCSNIFSMCITPEELKNNNFDDMVYYCNVPPN